MSCSKARIEGDNKIYFSAFDGDSRSIFKGDKDKFLAFSWITFNTNYQEEFNGLKRNQCYFSYSTLETELNLKRSKLQRIIRELESEKVIEWVHKSKERHRKSIILFNKGYRKQYTKKHGKVIDITEVSRNINRVEDEEKDTSSINISINNSIIEEDIGKGELNKEIIILYIDKIDKYLNTTDKKILSSLQKKYGINILEKAIIESAKNSARTVKYLSKTLEDWGMKGLNSVNEIENYLKEWEQNKLIKKKADEKRNNSSYDVKKNNNSNNRSIGNLRFNNFQARDYDYDDLEKKLLGWDNDED